MWTSGTDEKTCPENDYIIAETAENDKQFPPFRKKWCVKSCVERAWTNCAENGYFHVHKKRKEKSRKKKRKKKESSTEISTMWKRRACVFDKRLIK